jgi:hypothetical protein
MWTGRAEQMFVRCLCAVADALGVYAQLPHWKITGLCCGAEHVVCVLCVQDVSHPSPLYAHTHQAACWICVAPSQHTLLCIVILLIHTISAQTPVPQVHVKTHE